MSAFGRMDIAGSGPGSPQVRVFAERGQVDIRHDGNVVLRQQLQPLRGGLVAECPGCQRIKLVDIFGA